MAGAAGDDPEGFGARRFTRRLLLLGAAQLASFGAVGARLYQLQVVEESRYAPLAEDNRVAIHATAPERGRILDRFGTILADNEDGYRATLIPGTAADLRETLRLLALVVPLTSADQERLVQRARRRSRAAPLVVAADLSFEQLAEIGLLAPRLPGVQTERAPLRRYRLGPDFGHAVGYVGAIDRFALDDDPLLRVPGTRIGKAGVELGMEEELRGVAGTRRLEVDARGRIVRVLGETPARPGRDVVLTIDAVLQAKVMARLGKERRAAVVAMDTASGEVVAMGSVPAFDPAALARGAPPEIWQQQLADPGKPLVDRASAGLYPPGSTFKMVTALAALEAGVVGERERIACDGGFDLAGQHFRCWNRSGHGLVDLRRALTVSCDVYFYELARRVGIGALARMARRLGFGETYDCGLAQERSGVVPDPDWKRGATGRGWLAGETILAGIGQGFVTATPLQLAVMTARIATGRQILPTVVRYERGLRPRLDGDAFEPLDIANEWLAAVRLGLAAAVADGTGSNAQLDHALGGMAGKTGTAQVGRASSGRGAAELPYELRDHALFTGFAPVERPRYVVAAVVEHGGGGGAVAAPLARDVMAAVLMADPVARPARDPAAPLGAPHGDAAGGAGRAPGGAG